MTNYVVMALKKEAHVMVGGRIATLPFSDMADGCIGYLLIFNSKEAAEKWANGKFKVLEIEEGGNDL